MSKQDAHRIANIIGAASVVLVCLATPLMTLAEYLLVECVVGSGSAAFVAGTTFVSIVIMLIAFLNYPPPAKEMLADFIYRRWGDGESRP